MAQIIVFTDLDGTLLDHETYSVRPALPAVDLLSRRGIPVIPVSSKTAAEIRRWVRLLGLAGPFIAENGCGIFIPDASLSVDQARACRVESGWRISLGEGIEKVRTGLEKLSASAGFDFRTFDDLSPDELSSLTGLSGEELDRCMNREYDLPFLVSGNHDIERISAAAERLGLYFTRGGRFYHLTSGCNKGEAVRRLSGMYRKQKGTSLVVGIGDSLNDVPMLEAVDRAYLVQKPDGSYDPMVPEKTARRSRGAGPAGWRAAMEEVMILE